MDSAEWIKQKIGGKVVTTQKIRNRLVYMVIALYQIPPCSVGIVAGSMVKQVREVVFGATASLAQASCFYYLQYGRWFIRPVPNIQKRVFNKPGE